MNSGAAYVFARNGTSWSQQAYLKASNTEIFDYFGWSVSASGDTVLVGALWEGSNADGVNGDQVVEQAHSAVRRFGRLDANVLKAAEAVEVSDRLADVGQRQRLARLRFHQVDEGRLRSRPTFDRHAHVGDRFAGERLHDGLRESRACGQREDCGRERLEQHQKLWRTRKSTANVRSPVCVSTNPTRSLWSYSRTMI